MTTSTNNTPLLDHYIGLPGRKDHLLSALRMTLLLRYVVNKTTVAEGMAYAPLQQTVLAGRGDGRGDPWLRDAFNGQATTCGGCVSCGVL